MNKSKSKNGITLIALIITIIILLILAMVTIRILMNQGIIKHAQNATEAYNAAQNNETEYLTYAEGEMDKYAGTTGGGSDISSDEDLDLLRKYFLGVKEDGSIGDGKNLNDVVDANGFIDDEETIGSGSSLSILGDMGVDMNTMTYWYYLKYEKDMYKLLFDGSYNTKDVYLVYSPHGVEGEKREYNGEQWTVLYDEGSKLGIVSPSTIGNYNLGKYDPNASGETDADKAIDSYNNVVSRLNAYCRTTLRNTTARSVGSNHNTPDTDTTTTYSSTNTDNWNISYNDKIKREDNNWEEDYARMLYWGVLASTDSKTYWLASRDILTSQREEVVFLVRGVNYGLNMFYVNKTNASANDGGNSNVGGVRAIVTVDK